MTIKNTIKRLLQYRLCLKRLFNMGFENVFSYTIGQEAGVTAEQVRKDFSHYGIKGNKKAGYNIHELIDTLNHIFNKKETQHVVIVGYGNIGTALSKYNAVFLKNNIYIKAAIDIDPTKRRKSRFITVYPPEKMKDIIEQHDVKVAIISVPAMMAQEICDKLVDCGIQGIMNFAPVILKAPEHVNINNINLSIELESLIYCSNPDGEKEKSGNHS